jgi:AAA15 family ATPase/GTPase
MIKNISIKNFKSLKNTESLTLENSVILIGSNNTGKTTLLQAIALWHLAAKKIVKKNLEKTQNKNSSKDSPSKRRSGIPITRKEIFAIPTKDLRNIWKDLIVKPKIEIRITALVENQELDLAVEFKYHNEELIYVNTINSESNLLLEKPALLDKINIAFLPPMSGLAASEKRFLDQEAIEERIGEGATGSVLRNICYRIFKPELFATSLDESSMNKINSGQENWDFLVKKMEEVFAIKLHQPEMSVNGDIEIYYSPIIKNQDSTKLEIGSAGRGMQQVLLLLSYLVLKPNSTLLLDEPDAHLEVLKQQNIYNLLKEISTKNGSQIIAASHSEVVLGEAVKNDSVIAFYPHSQKQLKENDKKHLIESLKTIRVEDYYYAQKNGFVLYLEGSTDLEILKTFAKKLNYQEAQKVLNEVFYREVAERIDTNLVWSRKHFKALSHSLEENKTLFGLVLLDRDNKSLENQNVVENLTEEKWEKYEIENYFFYPETLVEFAKSKERAADLLSSEKLQTASVVMQNVIKNNIAPAALENREHSYWKNCKASEEISNLLKIFFKEVGLPSGLSAKNNFYELIEFIPENLIDNEIREKLDLIVELTTQAKKINDS